MATQTMKGRSSRARSPRHDCCEKECPSGSRNNYFLGKRLTPDSYIAEQTYSIERRRLINRAVHGWGVVYGFALDAPGDEAKSTILAGELQIGKGLAFDCLGREVIQTYETTLAVDNLLVLDAGGNLVPADGNLDARFETLFSGEDDCWLLRAHYAEKKIGQVTIPDPCRCEREEWDQTCEGVVYSLQKIDCGECCEKHGCELHCCCPPNEGCCAEGGTDYKDIRDKREQLIRDYLERVGDGDQRHPEVVAANREFHLQFDALAEEEHKIEAKQFPRGGCSCLCEDLTRLKVGVDCDRMTDVDDCTSADLGNGVKLGCLKLHKGECDRLAIQSVYDACGPRTLVKRNDLLFDLINGCDLTRITKTGWACWHRRTTPAVPFEEFLKALGWTGDGYEDEYSTNNFWVEFSRPVRRDTLTPDAFVLAVMGDFEDDYWRRYYRVPITAVETEPEDPDDGLVNRANLVVWSKWLRNTSLDEDTIFGQGETRVEIEVRGDLIVDCLGQQVDANSRGRIAYPSGNGSPGGTYLSSFIVAPRVPPPPPPAPPPTPEQPRSPRRQPRQYNRVR